MHGREVPPVFQIFFKGPLVYIYFLYRAFKILKRIINFLRLRNFLRAATTNFFFLGLPLREDAG